MKPITWAMLLTPALLQAQSEVVKRGAEVFRTTCAVAYCHGPEGGPGRAPQLAGKAFKTGDLFNLIAYGKPGTGMPAFVGRLKTEEIEAAAQYVASLGKPAAEGATATPLAGARLFREIEGGRVLFFDAVRMGGCGKCHELNDRGSAVGPDLKSLLAAQIQALREGSHNKVVTAKPADEDAFPALVVEQSAARVQVYDLSAALPVLRSFPAAQVKITPGSDWSHAAATKIYTDAEIESIGRFLAWVARTPK